MDNNATAPAPAPYDKEEMKGKNGLLGICMAAVILFAINKVSSCNAQHNAAPQATTVKAPTP